MVCIGAWAIERNHKESERLALQKELREEIQRESLSNAKLIVAEERPKVEEIKPTARIEAPVFVPEIKKILVDNQANREKDIGAKLPKLIINDRDYLDVTITKIDPDKIYIRHSTGTRGIDYNQFPIEYTKNWTFNENEVAQFNQKMATLYVPTEEPESAKEVPQNQPVVSPEAREKKNSIIAHYKSIISQNESEIGRLQSELQNDTRDYNYNKNIVRDRARGGSKRSPADISRDISSRREQNRRLLAEIANLQSK
jgi:hypothetical protein